MATKVSTSGSMSLSAVLSAIVGPISIQGQINLPPCFVVYGSGNAGIGLVDQGFATSLAVAQGTNCTWNLNTMSLSTVNSGTAPNDACGNPFALLKLKFLFIQNLGYTGSTPAATDILSVQAAGSATRTLATLFQLAVNTDTDGFFIPGPDSATAVTAGQSPFVMFNSPGAAGYAVATSTGANEIVLSSTASGRTCNLNLIAIGATA